MSTIQIAGSKCETCKQPIVLSSEEKGCARCSTFYHRACQAKTNCEVCGELYHEYLPPKTDPLENAITPKAQRTGQSAGPAFVTLIIVAVAIVVIVLTMALKAFSHGGL